MENRAITISESGQVYIPTSVSMRDFEIVTLFEISHHIFRRAVKDVLKSNVCSGDYSYGGVIYGGFIYPDYYSLDIVVAISFRVQSHKTKIFREYIMKRVVRQSSQNLLLSFQVNPIVN